MLDVVLVMSLCWLSALLWRHRVCGLLTVLTLVVFLMLLAPQSLHTNRFRFVDDLHKGSSQFDLLCSHMRLDLTQVRQVIPQNTVFIPLLRDPIKTFESNFSYYASSVPAFLGAQTSANKDKSALAVFLESPERFWDPKEPWNGPAKTPMSSNMGLNNQKWNSSWPEDLAIDYVDY